MKLKMRKDIQQGAARHANHPFSEDTFGEWCERACVNADAPEFIDALSVATVDMRGVATTCVTIGGEFDADFARRAIAVAVSDADKMNARNRSWVGGSRSARLAKSDEMRKAVESANRYIARRMRKIEEAAV